MTTWYSNKKAKAVHHVKFHGSRAAARKSNIHHKNAHRWLKENIEKQIKVAKEERAILLSINKQDLANLVGLILKGPIPN